MSVKLYQNKLPLIIYVLLPQRLLTAIFLKEQRSAFSKFSKYVLCPWLKMRETFEMLKQVLMNTFILMQRGRYRGLKASHVYVFQEEQINSPEHKASRTLADVDHLTAYYSLDFIILQHLFPITDFN